LGSVQGWSWRGGGRASAGASPSEAWRSSTWFTGQPPARFRGDGLGWPLPPRAACSFWAGTGREGGAESRARRRPLRY